MQEVGAGMEESVRTVTAWDPEEGLGMSTDWDGG